MEPRLTCSAASACTHFLRDPPLSPWDAVGQAGTPTVRPGASRRTSAQLGAGCDRGRAPLSAPPPFTCENGGSACLSGWCGPESHARQGAWQSVPWEPAPLLPTLGPNVTSRGLHSSQGRASDCEQVLQRAAAFWGPQCSSPSDPAGVCSAGSPGWGVSMSRHQHAVPHSARPHTVP